MTDQHAHICSTRLTCPVATIEAFLTDPHKLSHWAVGMGDTVVHEDGLIEGYSEANGSLIFARIELDAEHHTVHFHIGSHRDKLVPRIVIQVKTADLLESNDNACVMSMTTWRQDTMTDDRWESLKALHEAEIVELGRLISDYRRKL